MTTAAWAPVVSSAAALIGAFGASWITQRQTRLREEGQYLRQRADAREQRDQQVLLDIAQHVAATEKWIKLLTDDITAWSDRSVSYHIPTVLLTPRVELFIGGGLAKDWQGYTWQIDVVDEKYRMMRNSADPDPVMKPSLPELAAMQRAVNALKVQLSNAVT
jgi:hypothetical protein